MKHPHVGTPRVRCGWRAALMGISLAMLAGCHDAPPSRKSQTTTSTAPVPLTRPAPPSGGYVGSLVCRECHQEIAEKFAAHPMGRSASSMAMAPIIESFPAPPVVTPGGFHYTATSHDGRQDHLGALRDADQSLLYEQTVPMDYIIGSGHRGRSYLALQGDILTISPLTWYSQRQTWDLSPGYDKKHRHFERRAMDGCLQCHIGRVAAGSRPDSVVPPVFHETAIGCERCHGPAERHVEWHRGHRDVGDDKTDPIVQPGRLPPAEREAVCNQCHLLGGERVLRYGRTEYDFRPGDDLSAVWVIFSQDSAGVTNGSTEAVNQVPQMRSSRCFTASEGRLGCTSCHDPHALPDPDRVVEHYRNRCLKCHETSTPCSLSEMDRRARHADDSCIACHMPKLPANDVPHTSQTDHRIVRKAAAPQFPKPAAEEQLQLWDGMRDRVPTLELDRARGLLMAKYARDTKDIILAAAAEELLLKFTAHEDDLDVWRALGDISALQQRSEVATDYWKRVLKVAPNDEQTWRRLGVYYHESGNDSEAAVMFEKCLALNSWDRIAAGRMVHVLGRLNRFEEAQALAEQTVARFPWDSALQEWLANAYQAQGREADAKRCRDIVARLRFQ